MPLLAEVLFMRDLTASSGLALHVADVLLEELQHAAEPGPVPASAWRDLLQLVAGAMPHVSLVLCHRLRCADAILTRADARSGTLLARAGGTAMPSLPHQCVTCCMHRLGVLDALLEQSEEPQLSQCNYGKAADLLFDQGTS